MIVGRRVLKGREESQTRYYISSLGNNAWELTEAVQWHWGIESSLHCVLDVSLREDDSRIRKGFGATNMGTLRRLAISLLKRESTKWLPGTTITCFAFSLRLVVDRNRR